MRITRRPLLAALLMPGAAAAQDSALRIVVPFAAGSGTDNTARVFAEAMRTAIGRTVMVDDRPGGGTSIGSLEVSRARPDGSTILYTTGGHTTNAVLMRNLPYDPVAGFTALTMLLKAPGFGLIVAGNSRFTSLRQFLDTARAEPGKLTYGSSGVGNTTHVVGALFCRSAGVELVHVPYKGTPIADVLAGTIDCLFVSPSLVMPQLQAGRMRALGVSGNERVPQLPDVPAFGEFGIDAHIPAWSGFWGPPGLPPAVVQSLYEQLSRTARTAAFETYTRDNGGEMVLMPPEPFAAYVAGEIARYRQILPALGIQMD
ncbi:MAG: tripartite tricarboxylate transporter substrate binding protein [Reyranellaceae bacterium]